MQYKSVLIAVKDIEQSKLFYHDVLGLNVVSDFGANVLLTGGLSLQTLDSWQNFICTESRQIVFGHCAGELYFEEEHLDHFAAELDARSDIIYVHKLLTHRWGQRVIRFYDPDKNIIEVAESLKAVAERFKAQGLSVQETAACMDVSVDFVKACLSE